MRGIIQSMTLLQEGARGRQLPEMEAGDSMPKVTQQSRRDVVLSVTDPLDPFRERQRQPQLGANKVERPSATEQRNQTVGSIELLGQDARSSVGLPDRGRSPSFRPAAWCTLSP